jgi:1-acyl-sn-glycerol-3-phosphate acyltransferase
MISYIKKRIYRGMRRLVSGAYAFGFRKIIVTGYPAIKNNKPALFVANHQSTFMDGILMSITAYKASPYILVRADIFKSALAKIALDLLRLLPIYRKRDGLSNVTLNDSVFEKCFQIFEKKGVVALFPEGNHAIERSLRPVQKGAARIAFQAEERNDFNLDLSIVPVGLHYENHGERWHNVYVKYGKPFSIVPYKELYLENPQKAIKDLTDQIKEALENEMLDIKWMEEYVLFEQLRQIIKPYAFQLAPENETLVQAENELLEKIRIALQDNSTQLYKIKENVNAYFLEAKKQKLSEDFELKTPNFIRLTIQSVGLVLGFPFWLLAKIINYPAEYIIENRIIQGVRDRTWHISLRVGASTFLYPIYYGILWVIFSLLFNWVLGGIVIFSLPLISILYYEIQLLWKQWNNHRIIMKQSYFIEKEQEIVANLKELLNN